MKSVSRVLGKHFINGLWVASKGPGFINVYNPNDGSVCAQVACGSEEDIDDAVAAAAGAFESWSKTTLAEREKYLERINLEYSKRQKDIADALVHELGAPRPFAEKVQAKMFSLHFATTLAVSKNYEWSKTIGNTLVVREPIGVVGAITPWNWPLNQIGAKLAPALLAGNTVVLKPSEITPINAFIIAQVMEAAGLPPGVVNVVFGPGPKCGERLATHPHVDMVSFTGSTRVGARLHVLGADSIKIVRTELGGKSATIVCDDATEEQIKVMAAHILNNTGQSCNGLGRLLAPRSRYQEVCAIAKSAFENQDIVAADDTSAKISSIGPVASQMQFDKIQGYIKKGIEEGATLITGGLGKPSHLPQSGYFVKPTVFCDVTNDMVVAREEIFGPVLCIIPYDNLEEAITIANDTVYGLNNAVVSADETKAVGIARRLKSGQVQVNGITSNPLAPFGGYKQSGIGREWGSFGLDDFLQIKAINLPNTASL